MIPQIYIMAAITVVFAVVLWGGLIYLFSAHQKRYFWLLLPGLPLSAIANFVKPLIILSAARASHLQLASGLAAPAWFLAFSVLVTPLVEEPIKLLPLLLRPVWKTVTTRAGALWTGFALGVSFGLGEAIYFAYSIARTPTYNALLWYAYTGYFTERLFTCFAHGVLTAVVVTGLRRGGWFIPYGFLAGIGLHLFLNAPAVMYSLQWISPGVFNICLVIPFIVLAVIFERMRRAAREREDNRTGNEVVFWQRRLSDRAKNDSTLPMRR